MSEVTKLPTHDDIARRDAIDEAITDLLTLADLLQIASSNEVESIEGETVAHTTAMMFNRAHKLRRLMAEGGVA